MSGKVHAKTDCDDDVGARDNIDGEAPEKHGAHHVQNTHDDAKLHIQTRLQVCQENQGCHRDGDEGPSEIDHQFLTDHLKIFKH